MRQVSRKIGFEVAETISSPPAICMMLWMLTHETY